MMDATTLHASPWRPSRPRAEVSNSRAGGSRKSRSPSAVLLVLPALGLLFSSPAQAIDCRKATTAIDHVICGDKALQKADAALGSAYSAILKAAPDAEIRAMLVASEKRWLARRDDRLGPSSETDDAPDAETQRKILLDAIQARTRELTRRAKADAGEPNLIAVARDQRRFASRFTSGPFAGFSTSCDFLPGGDGYTYGCFGTQSYQNRDRVCALTRDWASGGVSETRMVGQVVDGKLTTVASCSIGSGDAGAACPDPEVSAGQRGHWQKPAPDATTPEAPPAKPQPQVDAEFQRDSEDAWINDCLTQPTYPPADQIAGGKAGTRKPTPAP
ncbi:lysozyme inhibitor LprI family protein [Azospirillum endophyticum]|nr:lysozyme inhibitor LprI family protein [Azospirillum endophyticum]